ncbi:AAA family ATPase [Desulfobacula sp.]|uniref:AAA family ATPase n=1 Tax=Desulfobacula sp. TaxID=2593537 RepID=UPI0025C1D51E|nr:AAA family ATPase [Desulfobacula sp.]MBC2703980.1 AAA family ATPase [Desulfobacula sp.]
MKTIQLKPTFVKTKNVRKTEVMMDALGLNQGEGCFGMIYGQAGRGKTRTAQWYTAHNDTGYLRILSIYRTSELAFLYDLCKALGIITPPKRKAQAFAAIVDKLTDYPKPVFLDEIEKMPNTFLEIVRDIADIAGVLFVFIGEDELVGYLERNRRVWSRTFKQLEFKPIEIADIIVYAVETTGLKLSIQVASILHKASGGDFRLIRRDLIGLVQAANANQTDTITEKMANIIIKSGFSGK